MTAFADWYAASIDADPNAWTGSRRVSASWRRWCAGHGQHAPHPGLLARELCRRGYRLQRVGTLSAIWVGLRLIEHEHTSSGVSAAAGTTHARPPAFGNGGHPFITTR